MASARKNEQQSFLFVISGGPSMRLTRNVPEHADSGRNVPEQDDNDVPSNCPDCMDEFSMINGVAISWIGHSARTIQRIIDELRKRAPRATVSVVTLLGGIETQLQFVPIQSEEQIEISLSSIETMPPNGPSFTNNLFEYLSKMNTASILRKSSPRQDGCYFDQIYVFMSEEDLSSRMDIKSTVRLAPIVRWFMLGPDPLRSSITALKRRYAPKKGDFNILESEDTVADDLINRLLPPPEEKPVLALGTKSAKFVIDPSSGVRSVEVLGFLPLGSVANSNLAQFAYDEEFIYEIGQDPDYDETEPSKWKFDIDSDYIGKFREPEQQLLPLLLDGIMRERLAPFCQVSLKENSEYLQIKEALAELETPDESSSAHKEMSDDDVMVIEVDSDKKGQKRSRELKQEEEKETKSHPPVYGVIFAMTKNGYCYEEPDEVQEVVSDDEGPSDDDDIDDIMDEAEGRTIRLKLALLSPEMSRPGWPDMQLWTSEFKPNNPLENKQYWETDKYITKSNPWFDETVFTREVIGSLTKTAANKDGDKLMKEIIDFETEVRGRCMNLEMVSHVLDAVIDGLTDKEAIRLVRAKKQNLLT